MSYNLQNVCGCPAFQDDISGYFGNCNYDAIPQDVGVTVFLTSGINTAGRMQTQLSPGNSKIRTVELTYTQRYNPSHVRDNSVPHCDGGLAPSNYCAQYTIDPTEGSSWDMTIDPANYQEDCGMTINEWISNEFLKAMAAIGGRIDQKNITAISENFGEFVTSGLVGPKVTRTRSTGTQTDMALVEDVTYESMMNYYCSVPFTFGGGELYKYMKRLGAGCCNDYLGIDIGEYARQNDIVFIPDRHVEQIVGTNHFFTLSAGAVQMITFNRFVGERMKINDGAYIQDTVTDPFTGITYDYVLKNDCGVWKGWIGVAHKLVFLPLDLVAPDDELYGANWTNHYLIDNA